MPALVRYGQGHNGATPQLWGIQDATPAQYAIAVSQRLQQLFHNHTVAHGHGT